ncbi:MAG TPA: hypothetical protein VGP36_01190 [Mycobacteriales bacterium]|nr:hypothetical protein [Mycobacteriales bacterium]
MSISELFDSYVLGSAEQQEHAQEVVGGRPFSADLTRGMVGFEPGLEVRAELIGTEATDPGSWMWSWANPSGFADAVTGAARHAKNYGEQNGVGELTAAEVPLDGTAIGYRLTVVTCGLAGGYAYYPAEAAPGTTAYLLLDHPSLALPPVQLTRVLTVLTAVVASGQVSDWRRALHVYAGQRGLQVRPDDRGVELVHPGGQGSIRVDLDQQGRVANIAGNLQPAGPPAKKSLFGRRKG